MKYDALRKKIEQIGWPQALAITGIIVYEVLVIVLLLRELAASSMRATDTVVLLLAITFLPVLLLLVGPLIGGLKSLSLRFGDAEVRLQRMENQISETKNTTRRVSEELRGTLSSAERSLYPLIGGMHDEALNRLKTKPKATLVIGSKDFKANIVVAKLLAFYLDRELHDRVIVHRLIPNGGTVNNYSCLINGWIDLFVDYTGTGCLLFGVTHRDPVTRKRVEEKDILDRLRARSEPKGFEWMKPIGTETNYCLVMTNDPESPIKRITELADRRRGEMSICGNYEFMNRPDGLVGLRHDYQLSFASENVCAYGERYQLVRDGKVDITVGHTTDPEIADFDLRVLADDRNFFPHYREVPLVRKAALDSIDGLEAALDGFAALPFKNVDLRRLITDFRQGHLTEDSMKVLLEELRRRQQEERVGGASDPQ